MSLSMRNFYTFHYLNYGNIGYNSLHKVYIQNFITWAIKLIELLPITVNNMVY